MVRQTALADDAVSGLISEIAVCVDRHDTEQKDPGAKTAAIVKARTLDGDTGDDPAAITASPNVHTSKADNTTNNLWAPVSEACKLYVSPQDGAILVPLSFETGNDWS